jgi:hypothetical protein
MKRIVIGRNFMESITINEEPLPATKQNLLAVVSMSNRATSIMPRVAA